MFVKLRDVLDEDGGPEGNIAGIFRCDGSRRFAGSMRAWARHAGVPLLELGDWDEAVDEADGAYDL